MVFIFADTVSTNPGAITAPGTHIETGYSIGVGASILFCVKRCQSVLVLLIWAPLTAKPVPISVDVVVSYMVLQSSETSLRHAVRQMFMHASVTIL